MNSILKKLKNKMARASIIRIALLAAFIIFTVIFVNKLSYRASVLIGLPAEKETAGFKKIIAGSEFKVMQSHEVIKSAMKSVLHLSGTKEVKLDDGMAAKIKRNLYYRYDGESMIFELEYFDRSKDYAVKIVNAIVEAYISDYSSKLNDITSKTLQMLYMKQLEAEKMLSSVNARYEKFCAAENIVNLENDYAMLSAQYSQYNGELSKINTEISIAEKLAERNLTYKPKPSSPAFGVSAAPSSQMEDSEENYDIKKKIRDSEIKLAVLKRKYTDAHPLVKNESAMLEILRNKITYKTTDMTVQQSKSAPAQGRNEQALELLKTKRNAYAALIDQCEGQIKSYPKKKAQVKSYEVEIAKIENILSAINKQIDDTRISQTGLSGSMPSIIETAAAARLNVAYFELSSALIALVLFLMSFKVESRVQLLKENQKLSNYKSVVSDEFKYRVLGHINKSGPFNFEDSSFSAACFNYHQKDSKQSRHVNIIRNNITSQLDKNTGNAVGITSLNPSEGKTLLAANIGVSSASSGQQTLVIDVNYKTTGLPVSDYYKVSSRNGLTDIIIGETPYDEVLSATAMDELKIISTGVLPPNVQKVMSSPVFGEFIKEVSERFGLVIADCPAFSISSDFQAITGYVKNVALVIDVEKITSTDDFREEIAAFESYAKSSNLYVLGVIFNER
ncbi:MAG TPA: hypothetical protein PKW98_00445 [Candidatus Wallbacteria bacterium]|nr:MAG: Tyrosine-protein kinase YwqD [bacterium ADurb.Bin243]HPG56258.1 hypothetical protein [Candidatus Wallbacteria bacterium]